MGENRVRNAPLKLRIDSLTPIVSGSEYRILDSAFLTSQPSPLWSSYDLLINVKSSGFTSFTNMDVVQGDIEVTYLRFPWGESATISVQDLTQSDDFRIESRPTTSILHAPLRFDTDYVAHACRRPLCGL